MFFFSVVTVSTAPKHYSQPDPNAKMSKNKKKKLKKKQKAKQALLENQMKELEEMEEKEARQALEAIDITTANTSGMWTAEEIHIAMSQGVIMFLLGYQERLGPDSLTTYRSHIFMKLPQITVIFFPQV